MQDGVDEAQIRAFDEAEAGATDPDRYIDQDATDQAQLEIAGEVGTLTPDSVSVGGDSVHNPFYFIGAHANGNNPLQHYFRYHAREMPLMGNLVHRVTPRLVPVTAHVENSFSNLKNRVLLSSELPMPLSEYLALQLSALPSSVSAEAATVGNQMDGELNAYTLHKVSDTIPKRTRTARDGDEAESAVAEPLVEAVWGAKGTNEPTSSEPKLKCSFASGTNEPCGRTSAKVHRVAVVSTALSPIVPFT